MFTTHFWAKHPREQTLIDIHPVLCVVPMEGHHTAAIEQFVVDESNPDAGQPRANLVLPCQCRMEVNSQGNRVSENRSHFSTVRGVGKA